MSIGQNIKRLRTDAGMSQGQLAEKIGKTRSVISYYESGAITPRMGTVADLARVFRVPISQIIDSSVTYVNMPTYKDVHERELIDTFRTITPEGQRQLMIYARGIAATYKAEDD